MDIHRFFPPHEGISLSDLSGLCGAELADPSQVDRKVTGIGSLSQAGEGEVTFAVSAKNLPDLAKCRAAAVFVTEKMAEHVPSDVAALIVAAPQSAFARAAAILVPDALKPLRFTSDIGISGAATIDPSARLEDGVVVEANAVIAAGVEIGAGSVIAAGAAIGPGTRIGRDCHIGHAATVQHALLGNNVVIHPGARIGQDGFGYVPGPRGLEKVPQIGRVIIQDHVEIGSGTTIDRGALDDTVIGEGTKIDNLVQIAHNVRIGRHCVIVAQVGIAGSATLGNGVMIGGAAGINGHVTIGDGAQIAALSGVAGDVPPGVRWGGQPARPMRGFLQDAAAANARAFGKKERKRGGED
ncbi:UDP-3-O-(3-hydroxymyristoyl)glucosamine N-acyltransferase [Hoeflea sp. EC-HK425]|uniref:UDP-3-O-(3-hydroxymyristoyl)glucosamine N-acyltransferase n=1 Tax=Hoeflea sp. EC-HK425 TaxID=2038388 RepID=UPI00125BAFFC|nr:UDP-3-O-(3-hydroxymyristoyl)glucosamine N-acyltransferase [Hoeflea sp. EC-HK425]VVT14198.1 UDP-3-O-(3-hydroxymyristoyl)-glucosamine N-acyltransferase [Hoeflea sp. EC-HK425]